MWWRYKRWTGCRNAPAEWTRRPPRPRGPARRTGVTRPRSTARRRRAAAGSRNRPNRVCGCTGRARPRRVTVSPRTASHCCPGCPYGTGGPFGWPRRRSPCRCGHPDAVDSRCPGTSRGPRWPPSWRKPRAVHRGGSAPVVRARLERPSVARRPRLDRRPARAPRASRRLQPARRASEDGPRSGRDDRRRPDPVRRYPAGAARLAGSGPYAYLPLAPPHRPARPCAGHRHRGGCGRRRARAEHPVSDHRPLVVELPL